MQQQVPRGVRLARAGSRADVACVRLRVLIVCGVAQAVARLRNFATSGEDDACKTRAIAVLHLVILL